MTMARHPFADLHPLELVVLAALAALSLAGLAGLVYLP